MVSIKKILQPLQNTNCEPQKTRVWADLGGKVNRTRTAGQEQCKILTTYAKIRRTNKFSTTAAFVQMLSRGDHIVDFLKISKIRVLVNRKPGRGERTATLPDINKPFPMKTLSKRKRRAKSMNSPPQHPRIVNPVRIGVVLWRFHRALLGRCNHRQGLCNRRTEMWGSMR